jgi:hypothetical protein
MLAQSGKRFCKNIKCRYQQCVKNEDKDVHLLPCFADRWSVAKRLLFFHFFELCGVTKIFQHPFIIAPIVAHFDRHFKKNFGF